MMGAEVPKLIPMKGDDEYPERRVVKEKGYWKYTNFIKFVVGASALYYLATKWNSLWGG